MSSTFFLKVLNRFRAPIWLRSIFTREDAVETIVSQPDEAWKYLTSLHPYCEHSCICKHVFEPEDCDLEIVVPCYNVEQFVEECLNGILSQKTHFSFFVTVVNDGSTDRTGEILRKYENLANVKILTQENKGLSGARNTAISQLHGHYVMFVDSDDVLCPGAVENLMAIAERAKSDIVDSSHIRFAKQWWYNILQKKQSLPDEDAASYITGFAWGKLFRRSLFECVEFPEEYWFQDTLVWMILESLAKQLSTSCFTTVRYRMNPSSISHVSGGKNKSLDSLYITIQLLQDRKALKIVNNQKSYEQFLKQMRINFLRAMGLGVKARQSIFAVQCKLLKENFSEFETDDISVKPIQDTMRNGDYNGFYRWIQLH